MSIFSEIKDALWFQARKTTQKAVAERAGITQSHVGKLLSGKSPIEKMQLGTLVRLFPEMKIDLTGGIPNELEYQQQAIIDWFFADENRQERYALLDKIERAKKNTESDQSQSEAG